ncbi:Poly(rA) binding protein, translation termination efficiency [Komagataella phaffii CBS 7435]|uniref:uS12 prolyl 3,4-dihydroxylase n=2 Tax=Komagataella phaffii TaxID=460519 RepID=C4R797_KOMPG|nr:uncharacterized protein PAS_chr4_0243 [Komagataella phaffii GS115]AOA64410.1 GQ67_04566T0 [Komagataella phaffii]CAH2451155.1 Poly(rA) binding protein, translation termination efficiency [Komagataella phaffii CBS 7435]AOA70263.1 GQ68_04538T0 [Komagataella phaffii GS115]CAY71472.1 Protein of unknown function [Komagataella phaffii GS115]CCA40918.1 Poly(rA) binding protein, translation termination efficiency [Komagataella phaffii CBS 7435]
MTTKRANSTSKAAIKKQDITIKPTDEEEAKARTYFNQEIFDDEYKNGLKSSIKTSKPYHWGTITELMNDQLLRDVRAEILSEIVFTKKETDIYKVYQSGDLANMSGLNWDDLSRLPNLYKLRSAIYSKTFRDYISYVTGCGKLSGIKTDMSINTYRKGCHLLTHDDVIGTRRVSFILYMPEPGRTWKPHYGGSLRLFDSIVPNVPKSDFECKLTPQFNQIAFFTVQPGLSFHDVEEVRVDKHRLSIQGWFHIPQKGEEGFIPGEQERTEARSTLQQLESKGLKEYDFPKIRRTEISPDDISHYEADVDRNLVLSQQDLTYLGQFINPAVLNTSSVKKLNESFVNESVIEIQSFLNNEYASILKKVLRRHELDGSLPQKQDEVEFPWKLAIPPHKQRYIYMDGLDEQPIDNADTIDFVNHVAPQELPNFGMTSKYFSQLDSAQSDKKHETKEDNGYAASSKLCELASLFKSIAFKKWLTLVSGLVVVRDQVLVRRFRPGQDFILATQLDKTGEGLIDGILEATLNLTPSSGWETGEVGGYELCMMSNDDNEEDDDPAIYKQSENDEDVLYTSQASWNKLTIMLRDSSVLKFVKYVSFNAPGSRWDINATWDAKSTD